MGKRKRDKRDNPNDRDLPSIEGAEVIPPNRSVTPDRPSDSVDGQVLNGELVQRPQGAAYLMAERFQGPLPPPRLLGAYDEVLPGLAERITVMAESEGKHRREMERRLLSLSVWGLFSATLICLIALVGGMFLVYSGKTLSGLAPIILAMATLAAVFIANRGERPPIDTTEDDE